MYKDNLFIEESEKLINSSILDNKKEITKNIFVSEIDIDSKTSKVVNKNKGKYITIFYDKENVHKDVETLLNTISESLKKCLSDLKINNKSKVLFVGLGNKSLSIDKLGYLTVEKIVVNDNTSKVYKNVEGITNIESFEFIKSLVNTFEVDLVVIIDSLIADNIERLGSTIQISTGGIKPGGVYNTSIKEISKKTLRKDVLAIGVPTTINIKKINIDNPNLLVSTLEIDEIVENVSTLLSIAINRIF